MTQREDNLRLLELLQRQHRNQRLIYLALAIAVASVTAAIVRAMYRGGSAVAYALVLVVALAAVWLMHRLTRENEGLRREATELARKLGLIP